MGWIPYLNKDALHYPLDWKQTILLIINIAQFSSFNLETQVSNLTYSMWEE